MDTASGLIAAGPIEVYNLEDWFVVAGRLRGRCG